MKNSASVNVLILTALAGRVNAHGYISRPHAVYKPNTIYTNYNCITNASVNEGFAGGIYNGETVNNAKQFAEHWKATGYKSLRDMIDPISPGYGFSLDTADPVDVSSYNEMWWQNDEYKEGFLASHDGPCEGWVGHKMVFHFDNCVKKFPTYPAKIPTDFSACKEDKCLFVFYWLALHSPEWQIYKQCVPISNGGSERSALQATPTTPEATMATPLTAELEMTTASVSTPAADTSTETRGASPAGSCKRHMHS